MGVTDVAKSIKEWEVQLALFEFQCPHCLNKIERIVFGSIKNDPPVCTRCDTGSLMEQVEWSVPARRNPEKGIQN